MNESWRLVLNSRFHDLHKVVNDSWVKDCQPKSGYALLFFSSRCSTRSSSEKLMNTSPAEAFVQVPDREEFSIQLAF